MNPLLAGFLRSLALAVAAAVVTFLIGYVGDVGLPGQLAAFSAAAIVVLRTIEGLIDQARKPNQNR